MSPTNSPVVKKKFWTRPRLLAAGASVALVAYLVYEVFDVEDYFDSERPPIIVNSGGSVDFDIHWHWKGQGEWKATTGNTVFQHLHPNDKPATIVVTPKKYTSCVDGSTPATPPFSTSAVDIAYGDGTTVTGTASLVVGTDALVATFPAAPTASTTRLKVGDAATRIMSMQIGNIKCTFPDKKGSIKVKQRHQ